MVMMQVRLTVSPYSITSTLSVGDRLAKRVPNDQVKLIYCDILSKHLPTSSIALAFVAPASFTTSQVYVPESVKAILYRLRVDVVSLVAMLSDIMSPLWYQVTVVGIAEL